MSLTKVKELKGRIKALSKTTNAEISIELHQIEMQLGDIEKAYSEVDHQKRHLNDLKGILDDVKGSDAAAQKVKANIREAKRKIAACEADIKAISYIKSTVRAYELLQVNSEASKKTEGEINPWKKETHNLTLQGKIYEANPAKALKMIRQAGLDPKRILLRA